jgi:hypothetical protein
VAVYEVPPRDDEPRHEHLDLRYLVVAPWHPCPDGSTARWFGWKELAGLGLDAALSRALRKAHRLCAAGL